MKKQNTTGTCTTRVVVSFLDPRVSQVVLSRAAVALLLLTTVLRRVVHTTYSTTTGLNVSSCQKI